MKKSPPVFLLFLLVFSCKQEGNKGEHLFTLLSPSSTNVDFKNQLIETDNINIIEYLYFNNGAGVAAGDINNDGLIDLFFTSNQSKNKLYLNKGDMKFEDITESAGVGGSGDWKTGVTMADVNGDGLPDIYVCQVGKYKSLHGKNQLFINQGNLKFKDEASEYGLDFQGFSTQAAFFDYDMDGDLDMYLLNHSVHTSRSYGDVSLRLDHDSLAGDRLYRNDEVDGKRIFHTVTTEAGIYNSQIGYGLAINVCDINNDGYPDIYISNDFHENDYLYINNRNGTYSERLTDFIAHTSRSSMGNDIGDINNDGNPDIAVLDMLPDKEQTRKKSGGEDDYDLFELKLKYGYNHQFVRNTLQLNLGGDMFSEIGQFAGVASTDWSWSPLLCDIDNDGWKDLFITNGIYRRANDLDYVKFLTGGNRTLPLKDNSTVSDKELYEKMPLYPNVSYIFRNNHDLTFTNMAKDWGISTSAFSNGSAYADLDNDGDLDLLVNNINNSAFIYRNNISSQPDHHFLSVALRGNGMNMRGIGARVSIYAGGQMQIADQFPTKGFLSASSDVLHFGVGQARQVDSLLVRWPDLSEQKIKDIPVDKTITLDINNAVSRMPQDKAVKEKMKHFSPIHIPGLEFRHKEDDYIDFYREKLIPHSLSAEGPALAVADVNGDGMQDIFTGGAKGQRSEIFQQQMDGKFKSVSISSLDIESSLDVIDAIFFDADGDNDQDLFIVRGGNELLISNPLLTDLLLINDGKGVFSKCTLPTYSHNGSCVRSCDFDGDGDIDLFIGSRSVPGAYGWSAEQFLLENDGHGDFKNVIDEKAPGLKNIGMVTSATWADYDGDGDQDLIVTGEWMNITIFRNEKGHFTDVTATTGLAVTSGWWNCIRAADIEGDGDQDLVCGNLGLNSMLKTSVKEPVEMYLNDFDNNGSPDQVICAYENGISYPVASFDELSDQISGLTKKYPHYSDFGGKTALDIFGKKAIEQSNLKKAELFESCIFLNNGNGSFKTIKLPSYAQFSPVRDIIVKDIDNDGSQDLIMAGNDYVVRPSYGRYDASYGWYLSGGKNQDFKTLMPVESGLKIVGDARKIIQISIKGKDYIVAAVNNGDLQIFGIIN